MAARGILKEIPRFGADGQLDQFLMGQIDTSSGSRTAATTSQAVSISERGHLIGYLNRAATAGRAAAADQGLSPSPDAVLTSPTVALSVEQQKAFPKRSK